MRHAAIALVLAFAAAIATAAPLPGNMVATASAAPTNPKVVIIVGAVHGQTDSYRLRGEAAYAEAIKYTPNVVKVFSPNATWSAVKTAVQGASIVVYMGHGNGWPSPYTYDPNYTTKNGFGLNSAAGQGDSNTKYYGEPSIETLPLAPNAVVLLNHLCYAAGNSEPGQPEPTLSVAKQRADNYASAFLRAGARAVIADGHMGPAYYIRALFTTRQTVDQLWRAAPNFHGNDFAFASVRSPGYTVQMDPELPTSRFYRAISGKMSLRTEDVTGAAYAATDAHPASFVVPGAAAVSSATAGVYADATLTPEADSGQPKATLALDARVRLVARATTPPDGGAVFEVRTLDGKISGFMSAADLVPRDSTAPAVWEVDDGVGAFSPNGDARQDTIRIAGRLSEAASWRLSFSGGAGTATEVTGSGNTFAGAWDGTAGGVVVPDGAYTWTLRATDGWGNTSPARTGSVVVDTVAPSFVTPASAPAGATSFSPNGDGKSDSVSFSASSSEAGALDATILTPTGSAVRTLTASVAAGSGGSVTWDGRNGSGAVVAEGKYVARLAPRDVAGNVGAPQDRQAWVVTALSKLAVSTPIFFPNDGDRLAPSATLSFVLAKSATVSWRVTTLDGAVVRTIKTSAPLAAGTHTFVWDGKTDAGAMAAPGSYAILTTSGSNGVWIAHKAWVELNAFSFKLSDTTPARGQTITVTTTSAEPLKAAPVLRVAQPGIAAWSVRMTKVSGLTYKATITFKTSSSGSVLLRISEYDVDGRWQATYRSFPLG